VTALHDADERLRGAFRDLAAASAGQCSEEDLDRVWRAVSGELPAEERREMVERLATDPACAEAWRVAHALQDARRGDVRVAAFGKTRSWSPAWIGLAAALVFGVAAGIYQIRRAPESMFRTQAQYVVESPIPSDSALPRDAFVLRWTPGPEGSRYHVRVTTEDLQVLTTASDISVPEFRVPPEPLSKVPSGSRVLWQVVASLPSGERVSSQTFVVRTQ
jgi:hypothetical protein